MCPYCNQEILLLNTEELSCPEDRDEYGLTWPASLTDSSVILTCPSGTGKLYHVIIIIY